MDLKIITLTIISIILFSTFIAFTNINSDAKNSIINSTNMIYVNQKNLDGPYYGTLNHPYKTINDALDCCKINDKIIVLPGEYIENLEIDKTIILKAKNKEETIINGKNIEDVIKITAKNVKIENFIIKNSGGFDGDSGINIIRSGCIIQNCTIYRTRSGILIDDSENTDIKNCIFHTNAEGVFLKNSNVNKIYNCTFLHNSIGIHLQNSQENIIDRIFVHNSSGGIYINGSKNNDIINSAICDNNDNGGGLYFRKSSSINVKNCIINHNGFGITIQTASDILVENCNFYYTTHYAIRARDGSENVKIYNNEIAESFRYAIYVADGSCTAKNNNIYNNYLFGLWAKRAKCDARNNWWGGITGPGFTNFRKTDRISFAPLKVRFIPWKIKTVNNAGADWEIKDYFTRDIEIPDDAHPQITFNDPDFDSDGVPDWWEEKYEYNPKKWDDHKNLDPDNDALNNIEECYMDKWGSNPYKKDIFLEIDWLDAIKPGVTNRPPSDEIELMKYAFEKQDITLHFDEGSLGGGEEIPSKNMLTYDEIRNIYWDYFLHNDLNNPRKGIFHYGLICDFGPGGGFAVVGWDHLDSFVLCAQDLDDSFPDWERGRLLVTGSMHELGHTLGLFVDDFGGNDNLQAAKPYDINFFIYRNYKSTMNYRYTWAIMDYSDGTNGKVDFNDWGNLDYNFFKDSHFEWPKN